VPKNFDDTTEYINKFRDIFLSAEVKDITILIMEVHAVSKLPLIIRQGMALSGKAIPAEVVCNKRAGEIIPAGVAGAIEVRILSQGFPGLTKLRHC